MRPVGLLAALGGGVDDLVAGVLDGVELLVDGLPDLVGARRRTGDGGFDGVERRTLRESRWR